MPLALAPATTGTLTSSASSTGSLSATPAYERWPYPSSPSAYPGLLIPGTGTTLATPSTGSLSLVAA